MEWSLSVPRALPQKQIEKETAPASTLWGPPFTPCLPQLGGGGEDAVLIAEGDVALSSARINLPFPPIWPYLRCLGGTGGGKNNRSINVVSFPLTKPDFEFPLYR